MTQIKTFIPRLRKIDPEFWKLLRVYVIAAHRQANERITLNNPNVAHEYGTSVFHLLNSSIGQMTPALLTPFGAELHEATLKGSIRVYKIKIDSIEIVVHSVRNDGSANYISEGRKVNQGLLFGKADEQIFCELEHVQNSFGQAGPCFVSIIDQQRNCLESIPLDLLIADIQGSSPENQYNPVPVSPAPVLGTPNFTDQEGQEERKSA